jgi:putative secretion ATPase (PEP-CTERM system associated)
VYETFYHLSGLPFQLSPDPRFYFASQSHRKAMVYLVYGLNQGEGFVVVTGDIGTGKTTLLGRLLAGLDTKKYLAGTVVTTQLDPVGMLRMVASAFGLTGAPDEDKASLLRRIEQFLVAAQKAGRQPLLIIDEVQNVPIRSLEELRMLSNFQLQHRSLLQTLLVGQPQFRATIGGPELEQLRQRVTASYHLGPLDEADTRGYIEHRLRLVQWKGDPEITDTAFSKIYKHSGGLPRRINTLCSRLLLYGSLEGLHRLDDDVVEKVVEELSREVAEVESKPVMAFQHSVTGNSGGNAETIDLLTRRIGILERYVHAHEQTIQKALAMFSEYVSAQQAAASQTGSQGKPVARNGVREGEGHDAKSDA